jgi:hypothetical protein
MRRKASEGQGLVKGGGFFYTDLTGETDKDTSMESKTEKALAFGTNGSWLQNPLKPKQARTKSDAAEHLRWF